MKFYDAKINNSPSVSLWGTGTPHREFLHVDDMADASVFIMNLDKDRYYKSIESMVSHINVGTGEDLSIAEVAELVANITGYNGKIIWDKSMPDGTPKKLMDVSKLENLGWKSKISLEMGLKSTFEWFLSNQSSIRY